MRGILCFVLAVAFPAAAAGQNGLESAPPVPVDHWTRATLARLAGAGGVDAGRALWAWPLSREEVRTLLQDAARNPQGPGARIASDALERLLVEFPEAESGSLAAAFHVGAGWAGEEGALRGGTSFLENVDGSSYGGPLPVPNRASELTRLRAESAYRRFATSLEVRRAGEDYSLHQVSVSATAGPVDLWVGRRGMAVGPAPEGSIVLSPGVRFDGGGVSIPRGFRLGPLGQVRATFTLARLERSGTVSNPYFSAARLTLTPRPWMTIGLNRAALFGGAGNPEAVTPWNVFLVMAGVTSYLGKPSGFENQVASFDFWMRRRIGKVPVAFYGEWGFDDIGFALVNAPAFVLGVELPELPLFPTASLGLEHVRFAESCCGHPAWYRHRRLGEGWTDRGISLGHPLGGHGTEWALRVAVLENHGSVHVNGRFFTRRRGTENLFSPDREGRSLGALIRGGWRVGTFELGGVMGVERGSVGWDTWTAEAGVNWWITTGSDQ